MSAGGYFLASIHREENVDNPQRLDQILDALGKASSHHQLPVIVSTHPRTRKRIEERKRSDNNQVRFLKPFGFADYIKLQTHARCVLSDSGTLTEESSLLKFPAVMLREAHERPEGMDEGTLIMSGTRASGILDAIRVVTECHTRQGSGLRIVPDYDVDNVSSKVVNIILSYTDYDNRTVWRK